MLRVLSSVLLTALPLTFCLAQKPPQPVQVSTKLTKPDSEGRQLLTVKIAIEKGWHIYANPAGAAGPVPTTVQVEAASALRDVQIQYPPGKLKTQAGENFHIYEDTVEITVRLQRAVINGQPDSSPLTVTVRYQACNDQICLPPRTVKLTAAP
jgi:DsbC/DsbD-like thiol-disulfide interchange protein